MIIEQGSRIKLDVNIIELTLLSKVLNAAMTNDIVKDAVMDPERTKQLIIDISNVVRGDS